MKHKNLASMHRSVSEKFGPRVALRHKRHGRYEDISFTDYRRQADLIAAGLIALGIQPGDHVAILSENRYEWLITDIGILSSGAADVPMHAPLSAKQVEYQLGHSDSRGVFVSNQGQADKVLAVLEQLPKLEFIVSFDPIKVDGRIKQLTWQRLKQLGHQQGPEGQAEVRRREANLDPESLATIIYTSGTTGNPKGVMLTHRNFVTNAEASVDALHAQPDDVLLSWLPYSHSYARMTDHYLAVLSGLTVCLAESMDTLLVNLAETQPTMMTAVPRFYEKVWSAVENLPPDIRAKQVHRIFGRRIRRLSSGGAPLPAHVCKGFFEAGIPVLEGYGLTETSPIISFNSIERYKVGTVGQKIDGVEVKIADDGEIITRGPHIMKGYWKEPQATAEAIKDGWFHTGDVGEIDEDGFLKITDRKKDLIITSGGKNISPSELERLLVSDPYIDQAVTYGDARNFVTALIVPNFPMLENKAKEIGGSMQPADGFLDCPRIHRFLKERIDAVMQAVSNPERVKEFVVLARPFQLENDELTATLKVRRRHVIQKFEDRLAALYDGRHAEVD
ncbi:MAG: long-chain fatty acid--CoA ligase [Planctomycetota bacterium]